MDSVLSTVGAELSSDRAGGLNLGVARVGRSNRLSPKWHRVLSNQLDTNRHVTGHMGFQVGEEILANVLSVELCDVCLREAAHLQTVQLEAGRVN